MILFSIEVETKVLIFINISITFREKQFETRHGKLASLSQYIYSCKSGKMHLRNFYEGQYM